MLYFVPNRSKLVRPPDVHPWKGVLRKDGPGGALRRALPWWIFCGVLIGVVVWLLLRGLRVDTPYNHDHQRLLASLGKARPIAGRLSGGPSYGRYRLPAARRRSGTSVTGSTVARSGAAPVGGTSSGRLDPSIALEIQQAADRHPSPENRATRAVLDLIGGRPGDAVRALRDAHAQEPSDPRFLNDLAAASLAAYDDTRDPWAALEAVEAAEQADRLEPSPPARFNLALALEQSGARVRAIAAWERYLELDFSSSWAQEAKQRLSDLQAVQTGPQLLAVPADAPQGFPDNPWARRQLGERVLLARWAERVSAGRPVDADAALEQAEALATTLSPDEGRLLTASIAAIREAEQSGDQARLALLVRGHQAFGQAFLRLRQERAVEGRALIADAIRDLQAAQTPFELRARVLQAWLVAEPDWDELRRISEEAEADGFAAIAAEERRIAAFRMVLEGRMEPAMDVYQDSQQRYAALGEGEMAAVISIMRTEQLANLGRDRESSAELAAALAAGQSMVDPWDRYSIYVVASVAASTRFSRAAVELRLEAADACTGLPERPLCAVDSWLRVAALTPDADVAENALQRAEDLLSNAPPSDGKARTEIDLTAARARWLGGDDRPLSEREKAADLYAKCAKRYDARKLAVSAADARAKRARLLQKLGRTQEAVVAYRGALQKYRLWDQADRFRPERAEKRSPAVLRDAYEGLIGAELDLAGNGTSPAAFLLSEEMRDRLAPRRTAEIRLPTLDDIPHFTETPRGTAIVEYAIFGDRAAAWILAGGRLDQVKLTPPNGFGKSIASLEKERSLERWKSATGALYQAFLAPVLRRLPAGTKRLVIVPDSQLYGLPFRALWNPAAGRYLDEDFLISLSPSVRELLGTGSSRPSEGKPEVLSLGFSRFLPHLHLRDLPRAEGEAASVLGIYGLRSNSCPVTDWDSFRRCAPQADVIHLATHATANSDLSWLAFPGETVSIEKLWRELPDLPRHPLVVLAACQSAATAKGGEGLGGLARPFLASGARVVGTLWEVDDDLAVSLFLELHHAQLRSGDLVKALGEARQRLDRWSERPWGWGATELVTTGIS
jgi:tetratricopeptide (TPR) repeat protein